ALSLRVKSRKFRGFRDRSVRHRFTARVANEHVGARIVSCVEPDVVWLRYAKGERVVLAIISAHDDFETVTRSKPSPEGVDPLTPTYLFVFLKRGCAAKKLLCRVANFRY